MSDHWVRCQCGSLVFHKHTPTKVMESMYEVEWCPHCHYDWLRTTTVDSMLKLLRKGFRLVKAEKFDDWDELVQLIFGIYRNEDPIFVRDCFAEASRKFMVYFNRLWARNLRSQE